MSSTNGGLLFLKVKQMLTPSVDRIFLKTIYCLDQELAKFCVELSYLYVPKFTPFSFKAGFSLHSDFRHVKILPNNMAQFVLGKLTSSKQIGPSQNWPEGLLVEGCVPQLETVYRHHRKQTATSRIGVL